VIPFIHRLVKNGNGASAGDNHLAVREPNPSIRVLVQQLIALLPVG